MEKNYMYDKLKKILFHNKAWLNVGGKNRSIWGHRALSTRLAAISVVCRIKRAFSHFGATLIACLLILIN